MMFSLTSREQLLVIAILTAAVVGAAVQHWRDARREMPAPVAVADWPAAGRPAAAPPR